MINFSFESPVELNREEVLKLWLEEAAVREGFQIDKVDVIFCSDEFLLKINKEYLGHDTYTDVIGFDYSVGNRLQGEIYISVDRVRDNAMRFNTTAQDELHRVMVHGLLHFCGWEDDSPAKKTAMQKREDFHLASLKNLI